MQRGRVKGDFLKNPLRKLFVGKDRIGKKARPRGGTAGNSKRDDNGHKPTAYSLGGFMVFSCRKKKEPINGEDLTEEKRPFKKL